VVYLHISIELMVCLYHVYRGHNDLLYHQMYVVKG
jgi:hypothetical protein